MESLISFGLFCLFLLFTSCSKEAGAGTPLSSDSFAVIVNNGYGGGRYKTGDTVHVFANAYAADQVFSNWSGDNALLNDANEWHTWFIMPDKSVNITGNVTSSIPFTLQYEQLKGRGVAERSAFETATVIYRFHHPERTVQQARDQVADWLSSEHGARLAQECRSLRRRHARSFTSRSIPVGFAREHSGFAG